jgi:hypothetical protein
MIREGSVNKWLMKNERVLNEMPWVRDAVTGRNPDAQYAQLRDLGQQQKLAANPKTLAQVEPEAGTLQQRSEDIAQRQKLAANPKTAGQLDEGIAGLQRRFGDLEQRQRAVGDAKVAGLLGRNPEQQIDAALNDWQVMKGLKRSVASDPQADAALTRAVMARAPDVMDAKAFGDWLQGHDRVLRQVLSPDHLTALKDVLKASEIQTQLPRPSGTAERPKSALAKAGATIGTPIKSLLQRFLAVAQGRVGVPYTAFDIGSRVVDSFTERETDAIWREALFNPDVAKSLATVVKNKGATGLQLKRLQNYLLTVGAADATGQDREK